METKSGMPWKSWIQGAAVGALATVVLGFWQGGWVTGGTAAKMSAEAGRVAVAKALSPVCVANFNRMPDAAAKLAEFKKLDGTWRRETYVRDGKWAMMGTEADSGVINACAEALNKL